MIPLATGPQRKEQGRTLRKMCLGQGKAGESMRLNKVLVETRQIHKNTQESSTYPDCKKQSHLTEPHVSLMLTSGMLVLWFCSLLIEVCALEVYQLHHHYGKFISEYLQSE